MKRDVRGRVRPPPEHRAAMVAEFERSGLPGTQFAKLVGMKYRIRHPRSRVKGMECETWDVTASHVYGQDFLGVKAG